MTSGTGPPGAATGGWNARVWKLAGPIILSNISTPLLGAVDTAVVGHLPDPAYIGGVAVGAIIFSFLYWGFGFLRMGTTGFTAQAHGAGDRDELRGTLVRALVLGAVLGLALIAAQRPIGMIAFQALEASQKVEGLASDYFDIRIWSAPASLVNYAILGWLLGSQRATAALLLQVALNGLNIVLDLVFVVGLDWGVEGVAWATLIAEVCAAGLGALIVARALTKEGGRWNWPLICRQARWIALMRVNLDIFLRTLCLILAFALFTATGAKLGDVVLAANAVLLQLMNFIAYGLDGFAHAVEILAGGAVGARNRETFRQVVRTSTIWAAISALIMSLALLAGGPLIIDLFTDIPSVRTAARSYLPWLVVAPLVSVWSFQLDGIFIGATWTPQMRNAMALSLAVFLAANWLLTPAYGNHGLWLALTLFMAARAATLGVYFPRLARSVGNRPSPSPSSH
jgi:MATE family multidrug resistance protein